ncbi:MAG: type II secretion system protein GspC [bacterium]
MGGGVRQYSWIIDLVAIFLCAFLLAKITSVYLGRAFEIQRSVAVLKASEIAPTERKRVDIAEYQPIMDRNIFDSTTIAMEGAPAAEGAAAEQAPLPAGEAVQTSLNVKVMGVLVVGDGRDARSTATIAGGGGGAPAPAKPGEAAKPAAGGEAKVYAVGDEESFAPNTKLTRVQPDRIEFLNNGRLEYAEVLGEQAASIFGPPQRETVATEATKPKTEKDALVKTEAPGKFTVDQKEVDDALQNLDRLYTEIRAVPNFSGGKVSGMKILSVKNGSLFSKLGLRRGDVLQKINGMELDVKKGFEIFNQLKEQKTITLDLIRQGQPTTLEYEIR